MTDRTARRSRTAWRRIARALQLEIKYQLLNQRGYGLTREQFVELAINEFAI